MRNWLSIVVASLLILSGCSSIEYRSDQPDKKPLQSIDNKVTITKKWLVSSGRGIGSRDVKLLLAASWPNLITADYVGNIVAIDAATGAKVWRLSLKTPISAGPTVAEGKLVVGTNSGKVIAADASTGKLAWTSLTTSEVLAAPVIADGVVYIHTMDGGLSALSLNDGRQLWRFTHSLPPLVLRRSSSPAVTNDLVIAGFSSGKLIALRKYDGTADWSQDVAQPKGRTDLQRMVDISADPVVQDNLVYAASYQGNLSAYALSNGNAIWSRDIASYSGFVLENNKLFVVTTDGDVLSLDAKTGQTYWLQNSLHGRILSKPAIMGNYLVIGDSDGAVHWVEKDSGILAGRFKLDKAGVEATPIVHNNIVYILGRSGRLVALVVN